jgi:hypothetical protein
MWVWCGPFPVSAACEKGNWRRESFHDITGINVVQIHRFMLDSHICWLNWTWISGSWCDSIGQLSEGTTPAGPVGGTSQARLYIQTWDLEGRDNSSVAYRNKGFSLACPSGPCSSRDDSGIGHKCRQFHAFDDNWLYLKTQSPDRNPLDFGLFEFWTTSEADYANETN